VFRKYAKTSSVKKSHALARVIYVICAASHTTTQIINCSVQMPVRKNAPTTTPMAKMEERYNELITKSKFLMRLFHVIFYELDTKKS